MKDYTNEILDDVECYKKVLNRELKRFPYRFWGKPYSLESAKVLMKYLFEERLKYDINNLDKLVTYETFVDNKLNGMVTALFKGSPYKAINYVYPDKYKRWQFSVSKCYWNEDTIKEAIQWLVEEKLDNDHKRVCEEFSTKFLKENGLATLTVGYYTDNLYNLLELTYPGEYKPWEISKAPNSFWDNEDNVISAVKWVIEGKLDNDDKLVYSNFNQATLIKYGLKTLVQTYKLFDLLELAYPKRFEKKKFKVGSGYHKEQPEGYHLLYEYNKKLAPKSILESNDYRRLYNYAKKLIPRSILESEDYGETEEDRVLQFVKGQLNY